MTTFNSSKQEFLAVLESVLGESGNSPIALHEPNIGQHENELVSKCLASGWVSSVGEYISEFENGLAKFTNSKHAIAVVNGTAALHLALHAVGVKPGDEVLVPTLSFVATANSVSHCGAIPHFVDSDPETLGLDPNVLREYLSATTSLRDGQLHNSQTGRKISAVVPMHTFGHPMQIKKLLEVAAEFNLTVVEDAAESIGSFVGKVHTGTFGKCGILSFNGNKTITTGGGGAILTNDDDLARRIRHLATTAKVPHDYEYIHDSVAFNYRMPNINAALGCAQLSRLDDFLSAKRILAKKYAEGFSSARSMQFVAEPHGTTSNYWLNTIQLNKSDLALRDELLSAARADGYMCRPSWNLLHTLPMYKNAPRAELPVAQSLWRSLINIPSSARHYLGQK
ncbi:MAG: LegC family aminotransferase [Actinomycetota bacterium]|nr:LegC family aminotransferase [Actinomycetota bacterium]